MHNSAANVCVTPKRIRIACRAVNARSAIADQRSRNYVDCRLHYTRSQCARHRFERVADVYCDSVS
ncbi:hypothetical protein C7S15_7723 [Burkholderia cepacia]|nr:hypothetical protein [Burkholderia cepacia]